MIKKILFTALLCVLGLTAMAQGVRISGSVTDPDGPVMMANVVEVDANNRIVSAAQTDFNGNFSMQIKSKKNKLKISYIGDKTKIITIGDQTSFKIRLESESTQLKEVVVKSKRTSSGGLMISKKEMTVSQQTFNMENVEGLAFTSADEALQGEIAGLDIVSNSGNLGAGTTMRLRGVTTINGNANPLIVVDDKIFDNPDPSFDFANADEEQYSSLLSVNVDDIASITVLKDAAATAVWGAQGSNGVIQITTKRGARSKPRLNFSYKFTGTWQPDGYTLLNGDDYTMLMKEEFYNPAQDKEATSSVWELNYRRSWDEFENWNNNTDWVKEVKQFGQMHSWNVNLSGGGQKAQFRISASYDHQIGSIIKQTLDRLTTRLVLDYNVSDRIKFSTNFALTYTDNMKNNPNSILSKAQNMAPNMSVYRQDADGNDTGEYYLMNPSGIPANGAYSSIKLSDIRSIGNPVAIANEAWAEDKTYRITPDFNIKYEILGTGAEQHRLTFDGRVDFDIYAASSPSWNPASLSTNPWTSSTYNSSINSESNRFRIGARTKLTYIPYFKNQDLNLSMFIQYEMHTSKSNSQSITMNMLPGGIQSSLANADLRAMSSGNGRSADQNILYNAHFSYKERYSLGFSLRADGNSKFGPKNKWGYFPGVSARYNISDEPFFKPLKGGWLSMLGLRASWGINGKAPDEDALFFNTYTVPAGYYGGTSVSQTASMNGLKLDDLRWEKTTGTNLGLNLGFFDDKVEVELEYYNKDTRDLLMTNVSVPSTIGAVYNGNYGMLRYQNVGRMVNNGWEGNLSVKRLIKIGKLGIDFNFNIAQNENLIKEMDQRVLDAINTDWSASSRGTYLNKIQVNNSLGSIYGLRYKGVYSVSYDFLQTYRNQHKLSDGDYEAFINHLLAGTADQMDASFYTDRGWEKRPLTAPVALGTDGKVVMTSDGDAKHIVYSYDGTSGSSVYNFDGGDAIYEDVNKDGQINALDVVYLGNALPKVNGGFSFTFKYGRWTVTPRFMYRFGNKIVNQARMNLENMYTVYNQSATVNWRWRKDGDVTPMPRALRGVGYNWNGSDRYVEDGGFVRFQNLLVKYDFPKPLIKSLGLHSLQASVSVNNLYVWTKYSGVDPEVTIGSWGRAEDYGRTPRPKSFTATLNVGF